MTLTRGVFASVRPSPHLETAKDDWRAQRACDEDTAEWFFSDDRNYQEAAKAICRRCPVQMLCLEDALDREGLLNAPSRFGVSGGLDPRERANLARRQNRTHTPEPAPAPAPPVDRWQNGSSKNLTVPTQDCPKPDSTTVKLHSALGERPCGACRAYNQARRKPKVTAQ